MFWPRKDTNQNCRDSPDGPQMLCLYTYQPHADTNQNCKVTRCLKYCMLTRKSPTRTKNKTARTARTAKTHPMGLKYGVLTRIGPTRTRTKTDKDNKASNTI